MLAPSLPPCGDDPALTSTIPRTIRALAGLTWCVVELILSTTEKHIKFLAPLPGRHSGYLHLFVCCFCVCFSFYFLVSFRCVFKFRAFGWHLCSSRNIEVSGVEGEGGVLGFVRSVCLVEGP